MQWNLADQRDIFSFYLTVISYTNSTCKVKKAEDVDDSCPLNFFHSVSYVWFCHQDFRRWASIGQQPWYFIFRSNCWIPCHSVPPLFSLVGVLWRTKHNTIDAILIQWHANKWQGILQLSPFFPSYRFGVVVKGNSFVLETYPRPRR